MKTRHAPPTPVDRTVLHVCTVPASLAFLRGAVRHLEAEGWTVHALSAPGPELRRFGKEMGVAVHSARLSRRLSPWADLRALWDTVRVIRTVRPTIVHAHTPKAALLGLLAAALCRVPVRIYQVRGLPIETATGPRRMLLRWTERTTCALAHRVVCHSPSLHAVLRDERLCAPEKCGTDLGGRGGGVDAPGRFDPDLVLPPHVDELRRSLDIPVNAPVVGFVGRLARDKGVAELTGAWQRVRARHTRAHLLLLGRLDTRDPAPVEVLERLRADPSVHVLGRIENPVVHYRLMDVLVLPTYREGLPNVLLEAAAMERPVVATRTTGCIDAVRDGETGILVPPRDSEALAGALDRYLSNPMLRRSHGIAGRVRMMRDFRPEPIWHACRARYEDLIRSRPEAHIVLDLVRDAGYGAAASGRRIFDTAFATAALAILTPVLIAAAVGTRWALGSPVLFRQPRTGRDGRPFTLHKFRTMKDAQDEDGRPLPAADRLTRFGAWMRSTSLDELPEFWDVLRGRMGVVGPRPLPTGYLGLYDRKQARRHTLRPGITGWAQVNGRNTTTWEDRLAMDTWYVDHASPLLDLRILGRTFTTVLSRRDVTPRGRPFMEPFRGSPG